jgi:CheY-like chemotaxis protein
MSSSPFSVFLVDDESSNREILRIPLEAAGCRVTEAEDGRQALEVLRYETFDLLILDLQMPIMDGRELFERVKEMPMHSTMRIVVLTANPSMVTDSMREQADFVVLKPINLREFLQLLNRLR